MKNSNYNFVSTGYTLTITVNPNNTASAPSSTPTLCINTALTPITHTTTGATGIGAPTGLPAGVTATWASNTITISGTPTASGTFNYSIPLTGGCGSVNATGTITVTPDNTVSGPSSTPTLCINTVLTPITHTTTGATGIGTPTGLPTGVSASWASNTITISGTPSVSGLFNYSIPLTGGCGSVSATGTITVNPASVGGTASSNQTICSGGTPADLTLSGHTGSIQWQSSPDNMAWTDISGATNATLTGAQMGALTATTYYQAVLTSGVCAPAESSVVTITVEPTPAAGALAKSPNLAAVCEGTDVSATLTPGSGGNGTDELEFRTHDGVVWSSWAAYIDGDPIPTWALTGVEVRTRRLGTVCPASSYVTASWTITPEPTSPDAGPFQTICFPGPATLSANTPIVGTGAWSIVSGPDLSLSQFSSTSAPNATFTPTATGSYVLRWTISNAPCTPYTADMTLTVDACNSISGVLTWKGDGVTGVALADVTIGGDASATFGSTAGAGTYSFTVSGSNFSITPSKHISTPPDYTSLLNGVDVGDATSIQQHVTGINAITDFYSLVAADCNKSGTITTADAAIVRQALLLNPASIAVLNNTKSWRFVPTEVNTGFSNGYTPPSPPYASVPVFPESRSLTGVSGAATGENFYGIKVGDVSSSANPANLIGGLQEPLLWTVEDQVLEAGETAEAVFRVSNFTDVAAFQMALGFDPQILQFEGIEVVDSGLPLTADGNFGVLRVNEGELRVAFAEALGATLPTQTLLFSVRFTALSSGEMLSELLYIDGEVMTPIAYTSELTPAEVHLVFTGAVTGVNDPALPGAQLLQNRPNPFASETGIGFVLPEACEAQLRVLDMSGRELWRITRQYGAGYHEEIFRPAGEYAGGILLYELRTPSGVQTRKMVWSRL